MTALLNNRYRIIKTLGRGGFGETYLTEDNHMPSGRKCVLKQLKPIVKQPKMPLWMQERFQREAAILEELGNGSSQIPQLYAYFSEDDKFYLVQEWIEGLTLSQYWEQEGNLHRDEVRQILTQLLPVLDYVHSRRIIHRDIKPENIILRRGDNLPFLIDFGAVKEAIATEVNNNSESTYSASIGTPGYMSSEQAAGRPIYSSDLYSLGLTAIFLLTGLAPHELETDPRNGEIIWRDQVVNLDSELAEIIDRAIKFHPRDRFATAQEMLDALNKQLVTSGVGNSTGVTLNLAPNHRSEGNSYRRNSPATLAFAPRENKPRRRSWLTTVALFLLVATGVAAGTFAAGFAIVSSLWRSNVQPQPPEVEIAKPQPQLFPLPEEVKEVKSEAELQAEAEQRIAEAKAEAARREQEAAAEAARQAEIALAKEPKPSSKPPKTIADLDLATNDNNEIDIPILTTGASKSKLVSTLGEPNSERAGWQPNSRVLVYYNVTPDRVNLNYHADNNTGKIRQTDVILNSSVSLGAMQQTLARMLGGNAPDYIRVKLRSVYNREANFSFFKLDKLEGKVQRDSRDRVTISVWERGFQ
ncbi:MAG: serine/threonine-protein kinase [Cyanobacteria bacterium P01_C01_bin.72]